MRKAQVTTFIILGIVIVAVIAGAFYFRSSIIKSSFETEREKASVVPEQIKPVKQFADNCVDQTARDAVSLLAFQGGYITLPETRQVITPANPFSNSLRLSKDNSARVAYWSYQQPNGIIEEQIPSINDMETQIGDYLRLNLNDCLNGLQTYANQGYNISRQGIDNVDVRIFDNNIEIIVEQPITAGYKEINFIIEKHLADVDLPLGRFYSIAKQIYDGEKDDSFIEDKALDMLTVYDELPYSDTDFNCKPKIWTKTQVDKDFKSILASNIAAIRIKGSSYRLADNDNGYFEIDALDDNYDESITLRYGQDWPTLIDIRPRDGELLKGDSVNKDVGNNLEGFLTSLFCINNYNFIYDVKYPVLIMVSNNDFSFQYALQAIIDNNQAKENLLGEEEVIKVGEICSNSGEKMIVDTFTELPDGRLVTLDDVDVKYKCITSSCSIGTSVKGRIEANFPACLNGVVVGEKDGYSIGKNVVSTNQAEEVSVVLKPLYKLALDVNLIEKDSGQAREPFASEKIIFEFSNDNYKTSVVWPDNKEITLMPGSYSVSSYVMGSSTWDINIASRQVESCVEVPNGFLGIFGSKKEECSSVEVPGMTLEEAIKGGANFNFELQHANLARRRTITLYTIVESVPGTYDGLTEVYDNIENNAYSSKFRYPELR